MTKEQAIELMKKGKRVAHRYFSPHEFIRMEGGRIFTEEGYSCYPEMFWHDRTDKSWNDGWVEVPEKKYTEEERDNFAISFHIWAAFDPQARAYNEAGITAYGLLEKYKDRPFINPDNSKQ